jgi:hypothetical protein
MCLLGRDRSTQIVHSVAWGSFWLPSHAKMQNIESGKTAGGLNAGVGRWSSLRLDVWRRRLNVTWPWSGPQNEHTLISKPTCILGRPSVRAPEQEGNVQVPPSVHPWHILARMHRVARH